MDGENMSMRATFTKEFIYDGSKGFQKRREKLFRILSSTEGYIPLPEFRGGNCMGQISGIISGLDLAESDIRRWIEEQRWECAYITKVPFRIVWLLEGGDVIIKDVPVIKKSK
ncbi:MAG TPA: hypothetical protein VF941_11870 [Clostridia bacterium]